MRGTPRWSLTAAAASLLAAGLIVWCVAYSGGSDRLNVILVSIDTLRPDRMGVYGHRPIGTSTTPFLDTLAEASASPTRTAHRRGPFPATTRC